MSHGHHAHHHHASRRRLALVLGLTCVFLAVEVAAGLLTGSLALLADAGHMLTDVAGLVLALAAMKFAERRPSPRRTYGYHRVEILAALTNALVLAAVAGYILAEAWERFRSPHPVETVPVLAVASAGLIVNLVSAFLLHAGSRASLTPAGEEQAAKVVRRHRLAERLFFDLLSTPTDQTSGLACRFEHILNEEVTEAVCTLLGHPPSCPHGRRIPPGACCRRAVREVKPLVKPLSEFEAGSRARIVFIAPSIHRRLDRLASFGILPGAILTLHQRQPSFVLRLGATEVAIEKDVAREIYAIRID